MPLRLYLNKDFTMSSWKPIASAPKAGGDVVPPFHYGPTIIVRDDQREVRVRWRSEVTRWDGATDTNPRARAGWIDLQDNRIAFDPREWCDAD